MCESQYGLFYEYMDMGIEFNYSFKLSDRDVRRFNWRIDPDSLESINTVNGNYPDWTALDTHQCPNCPLKSCDVSHCPVAVNMVELLALGDDLSSYEDVEVVVITAERTISQSTSVQRAVSSLLGLVIATSGCPHTVFLRPMARFHLPLATEEETIYRAVSMYLLAQHFLYKQNGKADLELDGLARIYSNLQQVNKSMAKRIGDVTQQDGTVNAIILLDLFAKTLPYAIEDAVEELYYLYRPYLSDSDN
ncbi:MAG: hypothetical protein ACE5EH_00305 [Gammaproteobacteria bacterium]